jgi:hypothetical protein
MSCNQLELAVLCTQAKRTHCAHCHGVMTLCAGLGKNKTLPKPKSPQLRTKYAHFLDKWVLEVCRSFFFFFFFFQNLRSTSANCCYTRNKNQYLKTKTIAKKLQVLSWIPKM